MKLDLSLLDAEDISPLTDTQEKVLSIIPIFSSLLSCIGSANIIYMVVRTWREKQSPYRRILLGMSMCDFLSSMVYPWQSFLVPQATSQRVWAIGTDASCSGLGFVQQLAFSNLWYCGMLSFYFLLTVRYGVPQTILAKRYEPWMHILSIGYPLVTAIIGVVLGVFHEVKVGHGCWVTNYPEGCGCNELDDGECCKSQMVAWFFAGIPSFLTFVIILVNNLLVYLHVRSTIRKSQLRQSSVISSMDVSAVSRSSRHTTALRSSVLVPDPRDPQVKRIRAVATQAFLYVVAFMLVYTPSFTLRIMESLNYDAEDEDTLFPLLVVQAIFLPLAGFFNCAIYVRPSYLRARKQFPQESKWWAFRRALHGPNSVHPRNTPSSGTNAMSRSQRRAQVLRTTNNTTKTSHSGGGGGGVVGSSAELTMTASSSLFKPNHDKHLSSTSSHFLTSIQESTTHREGDDTDEPPIVVAHPDPFPTSSSNNTNPQEEQNPQDQDSPTQPPPQEPLPEQDNHTQQPREEATLQPLPEQDNFADELR